jgi:hypothetical protein
MPGYMMGMGISQALICTVVGVAQPLFASR